MTSPDRFRAAEAASELARSWTAEGGPGGAIVLFDAAGPRDTFAGGFASLEHQLPFAPDTPTRWASISKQFCAATLLLEGVPLDAPFDTWVAALPPALGEVTLRQGLTMTGGLPDLVETLSLAGLPSSATLSAAEAMDALRRLPGLNAPTGTTGGAEMTYSNTGYRLVQAAFPAAAGRPFTDALRARLLDTLGLHIHFPDDEATVVPGLATGYRRYGGQWRRGRYGAQYSPSGGLAGSALTLARWGSALLAGRGPLAGMLDRLCAPGPLGGPYRLGLTLPQWDGLPLAGHGGSLPGYRDHLLLAPTLGIGVAVLCNREDTEPLWAALRLIAAWTGRVHPAPASLPPGLYAADNGPGWAEVTRPDITFMGSTEKLLATSDGARSLPASLDLDLRPEPSGALDGQIGRTLQRLLPVPADTPLEPALTGTWRADSFGAVLGVGGDGTVRLPGFGQPTQPLTALPGRRALASQDHDGSVLRACLWLRGADDLLVSSHRSRVLRFRRD